MAGQVIIGAVLLLAVADLFLQCKTFRHALFLLFLLRLHGGDLRKLSMTRPCFIVMLLAVILTEEFYAETIWFNEMVYWKQVSHASCKCQYLQDENQI